MRPYTVLFDANVLYPAPLRDLLMQLAVTDLFKAKWTEEIHREWMDALLNRDPARDPAALERTRDLMDRSTRDCLVTGYESLIDGLSLPDPDDRHVLAAAIVGRCDAIITRNRKDFPDAELYRYGLEAQHPDDFLCNQFDLAPGLFCSAVKTVRGRLKRPPYSVDAYLSILRAQGLVATAAALEQFAELI